MDPPDATTTFLGASPFANYLRELSSQDIADRASMTTASQNCLALPIALTIASCLDDPIADDCLDDDRLIVLPIRVVTERSPLIFKIALMIPLSAITPSQNDRFIVLPIFSAPVKTYCRKSTKAKI
jgi:hypothetical protein